MLHFAFELRANHHPIALPWHGGEEPHPATVPTDDLRRALAFATQHQYPFPPTRHRCRKLPQLIHQHLVIDVGDGVLLAHDADRPLATPAPPARLGTLLGGLTLLRDWRLRGTLSADDAALRTHPSGTWLLRDGGLRELLKTAGSWAGIGRACRALGGPGFGTFTITRWQRQPREAA